MDLTQLAVSPIQILVGLLSAVITLAGSYWIYSRSKRDEEIRWRIENIHETGLEEVNAVIEEEEYPGIPRTRQNASFWDEISYTDQLRLGTNLIRKGTHYYRLLAKLEEAERKFIPLNQQITDTFPDDVIRTEGTAVQLLAGGKATPPETESHGDNPPKTLFLQSWVGLGSIVEDHLPEILDVDSPDELREYLIPEEGLDGYPYPDDPTIFMGSGLQPEQLSFLDEEFPEWADHLYQLIENGHLEKYLRARQHQHDVQEELQDAAREVRSIAEKEIKTLNTDK